MQNFETFNLPSDILLNFCSSPLNRENTEEIISYCVFAVKKMFREQVKIYSKLNASIFNSIFAGKTSITELTRKKYPASSSQQLKNLSSCVLLEKICAGDTIFFLKLTKINNRYVIAPPVQIKVQLEGSTLGLEKIAAKIKRSADSQRPHPLLKLQLSKKREDISIQLGAAIMKTSLKESAFVTRFNEETFFKNVPMKPLTSGRLNLNSKSTLCAFAALYAMTYYNLSFRDIYTVDEVFSFSENNIRGKDSAKNAAALKLSEEMEKADDTQLNLTLIEMGETLTNIEPPDIDVKNFIVLAENYLFYTAAADIGEAFLKAVQYQKENTKAYNNFEGSSLERLKIFLDEAAFLSKYRSAANLCGEIAAMEENGQMNISKAPSYRKAEALQKRK